MTLLRCWKVFINFNGYCTSIRIFIVLFCGLHLIHYLNLNFTFVGCFSFENLACNFNWVLEFLEFDFWCVLCVLLFKIHDIWLWNCSTMLILMCKLIITVSYHRWSWLNTLGAVLPRRWRYSHLQSIISFIDLFTIPGHQGSFPTYK